MTALLILRCVPRYPWASTEGLSARSLIKHLGKAKVGQAHVTLVVEQHILELQVAVRIVNEPSGE